MKPVLPLLGLIAALSATPLRADPLEQAVKADMPSLTAIYRDLHSHPELSFKEGRSAGIMAAEAKKAGFEVTSGVGGTGVVAVMKNGPGPVLMLRADMDGLPVTEQTGLPYASQIPGVMHACGHDTHMTSWIGIARRMAAMKSSWSGTLVMIGQPAEEIGSGARAMLKDGLYSRFPKPSVVIAFHDSAQLPAGTIGVVDGFVMANVDSVDILVRGEGGHGAYPHLAKDPIVLASRIVTTLQTLVSREVDPLESGVVTVGSFQAGTKHNIIPPEAKLQITVRSYKPEVRQHLLDGIARIAKGEAIAAGMPDDRLPVVDFQDQRTPATFNTHDLTSRLTGIFAERFDKDRVVPVRSQMGGEDFSEFYLADTSIQSMLFWVGGVHKDKWAEAKGDITRLPSIHSPFWAPDAEAVISTAVEAMTTAALDVLKK
ncbi:amidohydrolase [Rhizorhabdus dicambivorans]|uniref:Amidohydrolase n=1 Tax=Rhizorhabdus dicambivorans TaxID=1850238 RepID=A0A2A4G186_9SPHN|nr:amidohydrolase [Rhizorhabdus dicambivorans]ATE66733.1 amidohydrolase [Rhizorhabdus dicambivorans]PCE43779.1 amidohydrolase [Rhizorhabdus dicambivorans]